MLCMGMLLHNVSTLKENGDTVPWYCMDYQCLLGVDTVPKWSHFTTVTALVQALNLSTKPEWA